MEAQKFLTDKKKKSFVEEFLTNGFEDFSFENTMMKVVNVDIHTLVEGDLTTVIITYKDAVVNFGKLEDKYFTKHILIDKNLNVLTNLTSEDVVYLKELFDRFKTEYILN